jgi:pimeloyl-ACP methyl ester carboxylesterase
VAAGYPDRVSAIALEDAVWGDGPGLSEEVGQSEGYQRWLAGFIECVEQLPTLSHAERLVAAFPYLAPGAGAWPEEVYVPWVGAQAELSLHMLRQGSALWAMAAPPRSLRALADDIRCPILLMTGGRSNSDPQIAEQVADAWRDGQHIGFADAGHLIHADAFEEYVGVVSGFLTG